MAYTANINTIVDEINADVTVANYLRPNAFRFTINEIPKVAFTCQSANLPGLSIGFAVQPNPFLDLPRIGDKVQFGEFTIRFLISEDMSNYLEIYDWLVALGFPNDYNQYRTFTGERLSRFPFIRNQTGDSEAIAYSDASLIILDSNNLPKTRINFKDLFPISIEALDFDISSSTVDYFVGIASFKYASFEIEAL